MLFQLPAPKTSMSSPSKPVSITLAKSPGTVHRESGEAFWDRKIIPGYLHGSSLVTWQERAFLFWNIPVLASLLTMSLYAVYSNGCAVCQKLCIELRTEASKAALNIPVIGHPAFSFEVTSHNSQFRQNHPQISRQV